MPGNDVVLLADMITQDRGLVGDKLSDAEHQTYFTAKHYLRHFKPTHDDLVSGIVDGHHDGGIDGMYIFASGFCLRDDVTPAALGKHSVLDLFILQVKNVAGFTEDPIDKLIVTLPRLLDFGRDEKDLATSINSRVIEVSRRFLMAYRGLIMPTLRIYVCLASLRAEQVHPNTVEKGELLKRTLLQCFGGCEPVVEFVDATALADMARDRPSSTKTLLLAENPISTDTAGGYIAVVKLSDYERFITGESGELDASLFEANVRDYEGETSVNQNIQQTLESPDSEVDFWWLNNGVTIVAARVQPANKLLQLDSPQIVNGLQTSNEIYKRSRASRETGDHRSVLIKVIQAADESVRDRIIRATNSQTSFGPSTLRATDKVQRQIEEYLATRGLYYERRRRYYFNQGLPAESIVSIDEMGQALLAVVAQKPHVARGRFSSIFDDENYELLFASSHPIGMFAASIRVMRSTEAFLRAERLVDQVENFVFHVSTALTIALTRHNVPTSAEIAALENATLPTLLIRDMLSIVQESYAQRVRLSGEVLFERLAKDPKVTEDILDRTRKYLLTSPKASSLG